MRFLFDRWWMPLLVFAITLGGIYAYETQGPRSVNAAVAIPLIPMLLVALGMLYMLLSLVYQLAMRRWLPAIATAAALVWAVGRFFL